VTNTNGHGERVALYIRVSTDEQAEHGYSIPEQRRDLMAEVEREGWCMVEEIVDDGYSGAIMVRPGLDRITRLAEAGEIDLVLAKKRNRLFRDRYLRMGYERALMEHDVRLVALDDMGNRFGDGVMDDFADWFRDEVRKNTIGGRMQKAREGKLIRTHTPIYGFAYTEDGEGFERVASRMDVVGRIVRAVAAGTPLHAVKMALQRDHIPAPGGGATWGVKTIREIVTEDAYRPVPYRELEPMLTPKARERLDPSGEYGVVWYPRRKIKTLEADPARGYKCPQKATTRPREEQVPIPVISSGIPRETFDAARAAISVNRPSRSTSKRAYELRSVIRCAECGCLMITNRKVSNGREYHYYRCARYMRDGLKACSNNRSLPAAATERKVLHAVLDAVKDRDDLIRRAEERYEAERRRITRAGVSDAAAWRAELDNLERRRANYQRAFGADALSLGDLKARTAELDAESAHVEDLIAEHERRAERLAEIEADRDRTVALIREGAWSELGITAPEARNARYREIGLEAKADADGEITLSWGLAEHRSTMRANALTS
jgi:site-specific DNA recombinase